MKINTLSVHQVYPVTRITGEGGVEFSKGGVGGGVPTALGRVPGSKLLYFIRVGLDLGDVVGGGEGGAGEKS